MKLFVKIYQFSSNKLNINTFPRFILGHHAFLAHAVLRITDDLTPSIHFHLQCLFSLVPPQNISFWALPPQDLEHFILMIENL